MMRLIFSGALFFVGTLLCVVLVAPQAGALGDTSPPQTVKNVELPKYLGLWHEIARIPNSFQDNPSPCKNTTAEYGQLENGRISVRNICFRILDQGPDQGPEKKEIAEAVARVVAGSGNAKLKVNFTGIAFLRWLGIGDGDYWILALGPENSDGLYSWSFVGSPTRKFGWVLSREPELRRETVKEIWDHAAALGYDSDDFISR